MPHTPDLSQPRHLDEIGWFLYHEKYGREEFGASYTAERLANSRLLLAEVASFLGRDIDWFRDKTVVSVGCGCTGDLAAFPASVKIAIDPLLHAYRRLGMLVDDETGSRTVYLSIGAEDLPLTDEFADVVICRNALDHMPDPGAGLSELSRILRDDGALFVSVDIGGLPTPDEPTVFSVDSLRAVVRERFEVTVLTDDSRPHSKGRTCSVRLVARKAAAAKPTLDKQAILRSYEARLPREA
jgi:SAM-dependent methyltransferase